MKKWKLAAGILVLFLLGVLSGSLGSKFLHEQRFERFRKDPSARRGFLLDRLTRELDLTEAQKNAFKGIVNGLGERMDAHFQKGHLEARKIMEEGFSLMRKELNPEQRKKLDAMKERFERREREGKPPFPPGP